MDKFLLVVREGTVITSELYEGTLHEPAMLARLDQLMGTSTPGARYEVYQLVGEAIRTVSVVVPQNGTDGAA